MRRPGPCLLHDVALLVGVAHLQQAVRLVQHHVTHAADRQPLDLLDVMEEAPGGGDDEVGVAREVLELRLHAVAAHHARQPQVRELGQLLRELHGLQRELTGRGQDDAARSGFQRVRAEFVEDGDEEGCGLAGARAGHGDDVGPRERDGDGLALDGGGDAVALALDGFEHLGQYVHGLEPAPLALLLVAQRVGAPPTGECFGALESEVHGFAYLRLAQHAREHGVLAGCGCGRGGGLAAAAAAAAVLVAVADVAPPVIVPGPLVARIASASTAASTAAAASAAAAAGFFVRGWSHGCCRTPPGARRVRYVKVGGCA